MPLIPMHIGQEAVILDALILYDHVSDPWSKPEESTKYRISMVNGFEKIS
jgi:hypothetical protein